MSVVYCHGCDTQVDTDFDAEHFKYGTEECGIDMSDLDVIIDEIAQLGHQGNGKQQIKDLMLELIGEDEKELHNDPEWGEHLNYETVHCNGYKRVLRQKVREL